MRSVVLLLCLALHVGAEELPDLSKGGVIELGAGTYEAVGDYAPPPGRKLVLRGKGVGVTTIVCKGGSAFLTFGGRLQATGVLTRNSQWAIEDLTIDGDGLEMDGIILQDATGGSMQNVNVQDFRGSAVRAAAAWDCYFANCRWVRCGREDRPVWYMTDTTENPPFATNVNNMVFVGCVWENNRSTYIHMGRGTTKHRFIGCKWHGQLPTPEAIDHIHCYGYDNAWQGCNFTNCGRSHVVMRAPAADNSFYGCHIGNAKTGYGIELNGTKQDLTGVVWSTTGGRLKLGNTKP